MHAVGEIYGLMRRELGIDNATYNDQNDEYQASGEADPDYGALP
jgi:hypothetical protein